LWTILFVFLFFIEVFPLFLHIKNKKHTVFRVCSGTSKKRNKRERKKKKKIRTHILYT